MKKILAIGLLIVTSNYCWAKAETLDSKNFSSTIQNSEIVVVDFWAPWCAPCIDLAPTIDELANQTKGKAVVGKVNIDENPALAQEFGIQAIPTILFFKNGQVQNQLRGVQTLEVLLSAVGGPSSGGSEEGTDGTLNRGNSMLDRLKDAASEN
jgi:thioredoxin 1